MQNSERLYLSQNCVNWFQAKRTKLNIIFTTEKKPCCFLLWKYFNSIFFLYFTWLNNHVTHVILCTGNRADSEGNWNQKHSKTTWQGRSNDECKKSNFLLIFGTEKGIEKLRTWTCRTGGAANYIFSLPNRIPADTIQFHLSPSRYFIETIELPFQQVQNSHLKCVHGRIRHKENGKCRNKSFN